MLVDATWSYFYAWEDPAASIIPQWDHFEEFLRLGSYPQVGFQVEGHRAPVDVVGMRLPSLAQFRIRQPTAAIDGNLGGWVGGCVGGGGMTLLNNKQEGKWR